MSFAELMVSTNACSKGSTPLPGPELLPAKKATMAPTPRADGSTDSMDDDNIESLQHESRAPSHASFHTAPERQQATSFAYVVESSRSPSRNKKNITTSLSMPYALHQEAGITPSVPQMCHASSPFEEDIPTPWEIIDPSTSIRYATAKDTGDDCAKKTDPTSSGLCVRKYKFSPIELICSFPCSEDSLRIDSPLFGPTCPKEDREIMNSSEEGPLTLHNRLVGDSASSQEKDNGRGHSRESGRWSLLSTPNHSPAEAEYDGDCSSGYDDVDSIISIAESYIKGKEEIVPPRSSKSSPRPRCYPAIKIDARPMKSHEEALRPEGRNTLPTEHSSRTTWSYPHRPNLGMRLGFVRTKRSEFPIKEGERLRQN